MTDPKLTNALDFIQGFIRPVTVVYEETIEEQRAIVGEQGMQSILSTLFVRIDSRYGTISVSVTRPGGAIDGKLTQEAREQATEYLEEK